MTAHRYTKFFLLLSGVLILISANRDAAWANIGRDAAVTKAEKFILANGYTAKPATVLHLNPESPPNPSDDIYVRHDTLEPLAYGVSDNGDQGWTVVFKYTQHALFEMQQSGAYQSPQNPQAPPLPFGRAVTMDRHGHNMTVQHDGVAPDSVQHKLTPRIKVHVGVW